MTLYERQQETQRYTTDFWTLRRRGVWDDLREKHWNMYISYMKQIASPSAMHETGYSKPVQWDDPEEWDGEGDGKSV